MAADTSNELVGEPAHDSNENVQKRLYLPG